MRTSFQHTSNEQNPAMDSGPIIHNRSKHSRPSFPVLCSGPQHKRGGSRVLSPPLPTPTTAGESVEENSNVVVKLLIRRPECFGPALRGEGGQGLLAAMQEAITISEDPALDLPSGPADVPPG